MNILLLGNGYIGSYIVDKFKKSPGINLHILTKQTDRYDQPFFLIKAIRKIQPDVVINACGYTGRPNVDACEINKQTCWDLNVNLPKNVSIVCETYDIPLIHISSGCIYTGYSKLYSEHDEPNFGLGNDDSSWYSKTKHAAEIALHNTNSYTLRVRMPFCSDDHTRNFLNKVVKYDNLIEFENSMTCVEDFVIFLQKFIVKIHAKEVQPGIFNVCNPGSATIRHAVKLFKTNGIGNANWKFVDISKLNIRANRSNCVLDTTKIDNLGLSLPSVESSMSKAIVTLSEKMLINKWNEK